MIRVPLRELLAQRSKVALNLPDFTPAAVLLLLYPKAGQYHLVLTRRTSLVEHHKGEVSLPGGAWHEDDDSLMAVALRENEEEIGVPQQFVEVVGELDDFPTFTRYVITPFVGVASRPLSFIPSPIEVDKVMEVPLAALLAERALRERVQERGGIIINDYVFEHEGDLVWGATARILRHFVEVTASTLNQTLAR